MARMDHNPDSRVSFGLDDEFVEALDEIVDDEGHESRSHLLRELAYGRIREWRDEPVDDETHLPNDDQHREVYLAAFRHSNERLRVHEARHFGLIAEDSGVRKNNIAAAFGPLRDRGFIAKMGHPPDSINPPDVYRVKPPAVDPDDWTHREGNDETDVSDLLESAGKGACLSHHWHDGECLNCGADRDAVESPVGECDSCGATLYREEGNRCGSCEAVIETADHRADA
ncbi:ribbon-helix-helix domain-containing protein [Halostella salina]|uniref:ribbon-helix-helix domain-containing protein n=1 Tax=Halostella salina TaxID=1547897 RepID=UPI001969EF06|nr:ribbon-helix-helix domain-containing protein [Halostella salina]